MRAWQIDEYSHYSNLHLRSLPSPPIRDRQIRIGVQAAGASFADLLMTAGQYQVRPDPPFVPGFQCAGEVLESRHDWFEVGDRVFCGMWGGAFAEEVVVEGNRAWHIPEGVEMETAAVLYANYMTAACGLLHNGRLQTGEWVAITGATGGVGSVAVQIAQAAEAKAIAVVGSPAKAGSVRAEGVVVAGSPAFRQDIAQITKRLDVVFDLVGGQAAEPLLRSLSYNGRYLVVGFTSGGIPAFKANLLLLKHISAIGVSVGRLMEHEPEVFAGVLERLSGWIREGKVAPQITTMPMDKLVEALQMVESRQSSGSLVLLT